MSRVLTILAGAGFALHFCITTGCDDKMAGAKTTPDNAPKAKIELKAPLVEVNKSAEATFALTADNTTIKFECSKPGTTHVGGFKKLSGTASYSGTDLTTTAFVVDIDLNSMYTDTEKLTAHLKTADFFDVKKFPNSKFASSKVEKDGAGYRVTGQLTMHGKTKEITFPATLDAKDGTLTMSSKFKINRFDWAISYGKGKVDDDVKLELGIKAKQ